MKSAILLGRSDNVVVATRDLEAGETVEFESDRKVELAEAVPRGHKVSIAPIGKGEEVRKYDEVIGIATDEIMPGSHVHVHVVESARLPGE